MSLPRLLQLARPLSQTARSTNALRVSRVPRNTALWARYQSTDAPKPPPPPTPSSSSSSSEEPQAQSSQPAEQQAEPEKAVKNASAEAPSSSAAAAAASVPPSLTKEQERILTEALERMNLDDGTEGVDNIEAEFFSLSDQLSQISQATAHLTPEQQELAYSGSVVHGRSMHEPIYHKPTHGVPVASLQLRSYHPNLLDLFTHFTSHTAAALGIPISKPVHLPVKRRLWTVPKSPFVHKKAQENFERKVYRRVIKAWDADQEVVERWIAYIRTHRMAAVGMRLTRWERAPVGVGRQLTDGVQKAWQAKMVSDEQKMKKIADSIIQRESEAATKVDPATVNAPKATKQPAA